MTDFPQYELLCISPIVAIQNTAAAFLELRQVVNGHHNENDESQSTTDLPILYLTLLGGSVKFYKHAKIGQILRLNQIQKSDIPNDSDGLWYHCSHRDFYSILSEPNSINNIARTENIHKTTDTNNNTHTNPNTITNLTCREFVEPLSLSDYELYEHRLYFIRGRFKHLDTSGGWLEIEILYFGQVTSQFFVVLSSYQTYEICSELVPGALVHITCLFPVYLWGKLRGFATTLRSKINVLSPSLSATTQSNRTSSSSSSTGASAAGGNMNDRKRLKLHIAADIQQRCRMYSMWRYLLHKFLSVTLGTAVYTAFLTDGSSSSGGSGGGRDERDDGSSMALLLRCLENNASALSSTHKPSPSSSSSRDNNNDNNNNNDYGDDEYDEVEECESMSCLHQLTLNIDSATSSLPLPSSSYLHTHTHTSKHTSYQPPTLNEEFALPLSHRLHLLASKRDTFLLSIHFPKFYKLETVISHGAQRISSHSHSRPRHELSFNSHDGITTTNNSNSSSSSTSSSSSSSSSSNIGSRTSQCLPMNPQSQRSVSDHWSIAMYEGSYNPRSRVTATECHSASAAATATTAAASALTDCLHEVLIAAVVDVEIVEFHIDGDSDSASSSSVCAFCLLSTHASTQSPAQSHSHSLSHDRRKNVLLCVPFHSVAEGSLSDRTQTQLMQRFKDCQRHLQTNAHLRATATAAETTSTGASAAAASTSAAPVLVVVRSPVSLYECSPTGGRRGSSHATGPAYHCRALTVSHATDVSLIFNHSHSRSSSASDSGSTHAPLLCGLQRSDCCGAAPRKIASWLLNGISTGHTAACDRHQVSTTNVGTANGSVGMVGGGDCSDMSKCISIRSLLQMSFRSGASSRAISRSTPVVGALIHKCCVYEQRDVVYSAKRQRVDPATGAGARVLRLRLVLRDTRSIDIVTVYLDYVRMPPSSSHQHPQPSSSSLAMSSATATKITAATAAAATSAMSGGLTDNDADSDAADCTSDLPLGCVVSLSGCVLQRADSHKFVYLKSLPAGHTAIGVCGVLPLEQLRALTRYHSSAASSVPPSLLTVYQLFNTRHCCNSNDITATTTATSSYPLLPIPHVTLCELERVQSRYANRCVFQLRGQVSHIKRLGASLRCTHCLCGYQQQQTHNTTSSSSSSSSGYETQYMKMNNTINASSNNHNYNRRSFRCSKCSSSTLLQPHWQAVVNLDDGTSEAHLHIEGSTVLKLLQSYPLRVPVHELPSHKLMPQQSVDDHTNVNANGVVSGGGDYYVGWVNPLRRNHSNSSSSSSNSKNNSSGNSSSQTTQSLQQHTLCMRTIAQVEAAAARYGQCFYDSMAHSQYRDAHRQSRGCAATDTSATADHGLSSAAAAISASSSSSSASTEMAAAAASNRLADICTAPSMLSTSSCSIPPPPPHAATAASPVSAMADLVTAEHVLVEYVSHLALHSAPLSATAKLIFTKGHKTYHTQLRTGTNSNSSNNNNSNSNSNNNSDVIRTAPADIKCQDVNTHKPWMTSFTPVNTLTKESLLIEALDLLVMGRKYTHAYNPSTNDISIETSLLLDKL